MNKIFLVFLFSFFLVNNSEGQVLKDILKKATGTTETTSNTSKSNLSPETITAGLKEALESGVKHGTEKLSAVDGFFKDAAVKILMPKEAQEVEKKLRSIGMGKLVDKAILSMNRAAEDAAKGAAPIFISAIKQMSIKDAVGILSGGDHAATNYLKETTTASLTESFRPAIEKSLNGVNAVSAWNTVFTTYNRFSKDKVNPDLVSYVTEKALAGIFYQIGLEEQKIRKDPAAQTTNLLKQVFGK
ncbi:MAG: DUF4197 domain-containing protein [Chitinophagaceae bacterium]|nr:DUF4197 domain-containing protein [Chitinophagaceae bacterium]